MLIHVPERGWAAPRDHRYKPSINGAKPFPEDSRQRNYTNSENQNQRGGDSVPSKSGADSTTHQAIRGFMRLGVEMAVSRHKAVERFYP